MFKKGFTLLEVVLSLIFISMIATYSIREYQKSQFNKAVIKLNETINYIISVGIISYSIDGTTRIGYSNGTGDFGEANDNGCSQNVGRFENLVTSRLHQCMQWDVDNRFVLNGEVMTGTGLMEQYGGCSFETRQIVDANTFDVFIDCSNIDDERRVDRIETMIVHMFGPLNTSDLVAEIIYPNALDLTTTLADETDGSGNPHDGILRARFTNRD
jgi:hypothetical protein